MSDSEKKPKEDQVDETVLDIESVHGYSRIQVVPGDSIGPFTVVRMLGEGGFGSVYLCEQTEPVKRMVAIKVIKPGMDSNAIIARFEAERQALAMMSHASIARVYDAGATEAGLPYFVMEYVQGVPITEYCDKNKLDTESRLEIFAKVCDGVQHAHQKGIIHRDLKPGNILVTIADRREPQPKIIDFGIAKATNQQLTEKTIFTQIGQMIGTPEYMSPEQAEMSSDDIDTRTDVYSLGVVLYELLSGRLPFDPTTLRSKGYAEIQRIIREDDPPKPSTNLTSVGIAGSKIAEQRRTSIGSLSSLLRQELEWIPLKALRKDRAERYPSADSLGQDVRRYLTGEPLEAGPETSLYRFKKLVKRNKGPFFAAGLIALSLIAGIIVSYIFAMEAIAERVRAQDRLQRLQSLVVDLSGPINDSVKNLQGGIEVRKQMITAGVQQLDLIRSEAEVSRDPELLHTVGRTLVSFGDLLGGPRTASFGDREKAREHYNDALEIYELIGPSTQIEIALMTPWILNRKADLSAQDGDTDTAVKLLSQSQMILRPYVGDGEVDFDRLYFATFERLGDMETARGNHAEALQLAQKHQRGIEGLLQTGDEKDSNLRRDLAMTLRRTGFAKSKIGDGGEADLLRSHQILNAIAQATPDDIRRKRDVGWANVYLGQFIVSMGDSSRYQDAAEYFQRGAEKIVAVCVAEPSDSDYRKDVLTVVSGVCGYLVGIDMDSRAADVRRNSLLAIQRVVEKQPENLALAETLESLKAVPTENP